MIIGAGSLVNKDIPDNGVAAGVPARVIGTFEDFVEKRLKWAGGIAIGHLRRAVQVFPMKRSDISGKNLRQIGE